MKVNLVFRYAFLGPLEDQDLNGINTTSFVSRSLLSELSNAAKPPEFLNQLIEKNKLEIRTGEGFYTYGEVKGEEKMRKKEVVFLDLRKNRMNNNGNEIQVIL